MGGASDDGDFDDEVFRYALLVESSGLDVMLEILAFFVEGSIGFATVSSRSP